MTRVGVEPTTADQENARGSTTRGRLCIHADVDRGSHALGGPFPTKGELPMPIPPIPRPAARAPAFLALLLLVGCASSPFAGRDLRSVYPAVPRIVAVGDIHGDLEAARRALLLAGAVDADGRWSGGRLVLIQTGDILDRGDDEPEILDLFDSLAVQARASRGAVLLLNGNHELMNVYQDFRYVTEDGFADYAGTPPPATPDSAFLALDPARRGRAAAFLPGGPMARRLARRNTAVVVGSTLFVHGGFLPAHVDLGLDSLNARVRAWLVGEVPRPDWIRGDGSPVWSRLYSAAPSQDACDTLSSVLERMGVARMVVGHTVQRTGITAFCGGRVWAIDVGMARYYRGRTEVLEIRRDAVRSLR